MPNPTRRLRVLMEVFMFGIFKQGRHGMIWCCNEETLEQARTVGEEHRDNPDVDFIIIMPVADVLDFDGTRE